MLQAIEAKSEWSLTDSAWPSVDHDNSCLSTIYEMALTIDGTMAQAFGLEIFSHEGRLILQLLRKRRLIIKDAWLSSRLSSRAFHELLKRMEAQGVVEVNPSEIDRRTKSIGLTCDFRSRFVSQLRTLGELKRDLRTAGGTAA